MNPLLLLLFEALVFPVGPGLFALMRGAGLSAHLALEAMGLTALAIGLGVGLGLPINPILFLLLLYLITRRARALTDAGNLLSRWGYPQAAIGLNRLTLRLWPDATSRAIAFINLGAAYTQMEAVEAAVDAFQQALAACPEGLCPLHSAVAHLNLGNVYYRQGKSHQAIREFQAAVQAFPGSPYERRAQRAIREIMRPKHVEEKGRKAGRGES